MRKTVFDMEINVTKSEKPILRDDRGRWLPGSGSPSPGRPIAARQRISEAAARPVGSLGRARQGRSYQAGGVRSRQAGNDRLWLIAERRIHQRRAEDTRQS